MAGPLTYLMQRADATKREVKDWIDNPRDNLSKLNNSGLGNEASTSDGALSKMPIDTREVTNQAMNSVLPVGYTLLKYPDMAVERGGLVVLKNPTRQMAMNAAAKSEGKSLRVFTTKSGDTYAWPAYDATHSQVRNKLADEGRLRSSDVLEHLELSPHEVVNHPIPIFAEDVVDKSNPLALDYALRNGLLGE